MTAEQGTPSGKKSLLPIALDAMGGDYGVEPNVAGAVAAARAGVTVLLIGREPQLHAELAKYPGSSSLPLRVIDTPDVIGMDEHARDFRSR